MKAFLDICEPLVDTGQTWTFGQPSPPKHHNHMDFRRLKIRHVTFFMWTLVDNSGPNYPLCTRDLWMFPQRYVKIGFSKLLKRYCRLFLCSTLKIYIEGLDQYCCNSMASGLISPEKTAPNQCDHLRVFRAEQGDTFSKI